MKSSPLVGWKKGFFCLLLAASSSSIPPCAKTLLFVLAITSNQTWSTGPDSKDTRTSLRIFFLDQWDVGIHSKKLFFWGRIKLLAHSYQGINETPLLCWKHRAPNFFNGPFVALGDKVHFAPWESIFRLFVSKLWSFFVKRKKATDVPKSLPPPNCGGTVGQ